MELFKIFVFEFLFGYIMQAFAFILGVFAFNRQKIIVKSYVTVSLLVSVFYFLVRQLPISFGVHTIINLLLLLLVCIFIFKMPIYATIRSTLLVTVFLLASEILNVWLMISILGRDKFEQEMSVALNKAIIGLPGSFAFAILILVTYLLSTKSEKNKSENDGEIST
jgi:hypothetical protein